MVHLERAAHQHQVVHQLVVPLQAAVLHQLEKDLLYVLTLTKTDTVTHTETHYHHHQQEGMDKAILISIQILVTDFCENQ